MRRELGTILFGLLAAACGGKSTAVLQSAPEPSNFPTPPSAPYGCDGDDGQRPSFAREHRTLAAGPDLRFEAVSVDGTLVAYTTASPTVLLPGVEGGQRDLFVVPAAGGEPTPVAFSLRDLPGEAELLVRFEGRTLLVFLSRLRDVAEQLAVFRPGDEAMTVVASGVDPTAVRSSRDGRFLSIEANDRRGDDKDTADLVLLEVSTLATTLVASLDPARARFTRDSAYLVYGGHLPEERCPVSVERRSLDDGTVTPVTCIRTDSRWELSRDSAWLVHADTWEHYAPDPAVERRCPELLLATSLDGAEQRVLSDCLLQAGEGKELDLSRSGDTVSFVTRARDREDGGGALMTVPFDGGEPVELVPSDVLSIVEHVPGAVVFARAGVYVEGGECADDRFVSVPDTGGDLHELGRATSYCDTPVVNEAGVTAVDGSLLALGSDGELRYQPDATAAPFLIGCGVGQAALSDDRHVLFSAPHADGTGLFRYDAETGRIEEAEPAIRARFGGGPDVGKAFLAAVPAGEEFSLIRGSF